MCSTKQIPPLSIFSTRLKLIASLSSVLQPCGRDMFLRNNLWFCCSFRPNDSVETKWIQIPKHFHHSFTNYMTFLFSVTECEVQERLMGQHRGFGRAMHPPLTSLCSPLKHRWKSKRWS